MANMDATNRQERSMHEMEERRRALLEQELKILTSYIDPHKMTMVEVFALNDLLNSLATLMERLRYFRQLPPAAVGEMLGAMLRLAGLPTETKATHSSTASTALMRIVGRHE